MAKPIDLVGRPRQVLGKAVRHLRAEGMVPANIYGHNLPSTAITVEEHALGRALHQAGRTRLIELRLADERPRPVLVRDVQRDPRTGRLVHVDFYQVRMDQPIMARVPVHLVGEAPALRQAGAILLHAGTTVEIEALPSELPSAVAVDLSSLDEVDAAIHAGDLPLPPTARLVSDPEELIVKIGTARVEVPEAAPAPAEVPAEAPVKPVAEEASE